MSLNMNRLTAWLKERRLRTDTRAVRRERLTYLSLDKLARLESAVREVETRGVRGDVLEFGVAMGGSAIVLAGHARGGRRFHGFDVFGMIPPPTSDKDDQHSKDRYDVIASGRSKGIGGDEYYGYRDNLFDGVLASFRQHGRPVDGVNVVLHKGLFEETWPRADIEIIAFVHIDCDWYDPVRYCLHAVADKISVGGILLIDDYNDYGGARAAVDEFLAVRTDFTFEPGVNPIIRKRPGLS